MNPTDLAPLVSAAPVQAASFNWSSVLPIATGAVIALLGVLVTAIINYRLKHQELSRLDRVEEQKRVSDFANKYSDKLRVINGHIFDVVEKHLECYETAVGLQRYISVGESSGHIKIMMPSFATRAKELAESSKEFYSNSLTVDNARIARLIVLDLSTEMVWSSHSSIIREKINQLVESTRKRLITASEKYYLAEAYLTNVRREGTQEEIEEAVASLKLGCEAIIEAWQSVSSLTTEALSATGTIQGYLEAEVSASRKARKPWWKRRG